MLRRRCPETNSVYFDEFPNSFKTRNGRVVAWSGNNERRLLVNLTMHGEELLIVGIHECAYHCDPICRGRNC